MAIEVDFPAAIYAALTGDVPLMAKAKAVVSRRPQTDDGGDAAAFPLIVMRYFFNEDGDKGKNGHNILLRLQTWSRSGSNLEAREIQGLIYAVLDKQEAAISVAGHTLVSLVRESSTTEIDGEGDRGICDYRALIKET